MTLRHSSSKYVKYSSSSLLDSRSDGSPIFATTSGPGHYAYGIFFSIVLLLFARPMVAAFTPDLSLQAAAVTLLYLSIVFQLVDAANVVARGVLRGVGDVTYPAVVAIGAAWVFTPPLTWLFGYALELGAAGGWMALIVECSVSAALMWRRMVRGPRPDLAAARPSIA